MRCPGRVLKNGRITGHGEAKSLLNDEKVSNAYLGTGSFRSAAMISQLLAQTVVNGVNAGALYGLAAVVLSPRN